MVAEPNSGFCEESSHSTKEEIARLLAVYAAYDYRRWDATIPGNQRMGEELISAAVSMAQAIDWNLQADKVLDVGCGDGSTLARMGQELGIDRSRLFGVDLLQRAIDTGRRKYAGLNLSCANAERLAYPDQSFALITIFTVFSSIHDPVMRARIAREAARVLRPGGAILVYDLRYPSLTNSAVRPITLPALKALLPGFVMCSRSITLLPPLARSLKGRWIALYPRLVRLSALRSHYLCILRR